MTINKDIKILCSNRISSRLKLHNITIAGTSNTPLLQPRLLVFAVDAAEGKTVTFDSYPKADGSRKSEYGEFIEGLGIYENVINYDDGISIKQVMASGTLSVFYDYASIAMDAAGDLKSQDEKGLTDKGDKKNIRYFWDGGLLSNTPLRELLQAHREYWHDVEKRDNIPDLDVYIINVHLPKWIST
jgi:NTE family protein